jgi:hypothetical protein
VTGERASSCQTQNFAGARPVRVGAGGSKPVIKGTRALR